jgi:hypothetical protein
VTGFKAENIREPTGPPPGGHIPALNATPTFGSDKALQTPYAIALANCSAPSSGVTLVSFNDALELALMKLCILCAIDNPTGEVDLLTTAIIPPCYFGQKTGIRII